MAAEYYYRDEDHLSGILSWEDFVCRNPNRSIRDLQNWQSLRDDWFAERGYPKEDFSDRRAGSGDTTRSFHAEAAERPLDFFGGLPEEEEDY